MGEVERLQATVDAFCRFIEGLPDRKWKRTCATTTGS